MATSKFSSFSLLPAEIRLRIWEAALPDPIDKPLFFWRNSRRRASEDKWDITNRWLNHDVYPLDIGFSEVEIPHLQVNWEAHQVAEDWLHRQGLRVDTRRVYTNVQEEEHNYNNNNNNKNNTALIYRKFDPKRDTVFVPATGAEVGNFVTLVYHLSDIFDGLSGVMINEIVLRDLMRNVALPQTLWFRFDDFRRTTWLEPLCRAMCAWCRNLYLMLDVPLELQLAKMVPGPVFREKWELELLEHFPRASSGAKSGWAIDEGSAASSASIAIYQSAKQLLQLITGIELPEPLPQSIAANLPAGEFQIQFARAVKK
ncbi:hypothetical protein BP00DRAFT_414850 [Aspergillus indologenus CBS 114.80]|uniref:2EXR domain-containing protein n=1 Tax=Aspergillus indologenus CBS 114.80 TaxID=1450541 RepID=A0A2V5I667_9EURO|nr:hypothetical protein BP00DRAFT_414850 [Aspergillus indologenus CBS 114.80]